MPAPDSTHDQSLTGADFFRVSPMVLFPETMNDFSVYLKHEGGYTLYCHADERFTEKHRRLLYENGVAEVYVQLKEKDQFERYLEDHLGEILSNEALPLKERSRVLYSVSSSLVEETFRTRLPASIRRESFDRVTAMVRKGTEFLTQKDSLRAMASLISNHYQTYTHSVHVFVYATAVLQAYDFSREELVQIGLGAVLHARQHPSRKGRVSVRFHALVPGRSELHSLPPRAHGRPGLPIRHGRGQHSTAGTGGLRVRRLRRPDIGQTIRRRTGTL